MKTLTGWTAIAALTIMAAGCAAGSAGPPPSPYAEILGTWTGPAYAEGDEEPVSVTVVLEMVEGALSGHVTVPEQMMNRVPSRNLIYEDGTLSCSVQMVDESGYAVQLDIRLTLKDDVFEGTFDSEAVYGYMTLKRKPPSDNQGTGMLL